MGRSRMFSPALQRSIPISSYEVRVTGMAASGIKGDRHQECYGIVVVRLLDELWYKGLFSEVGLPDLHSAKKSSDRACQSTHSHFYTSVVYRIR